MHRCRSRRIFGGAKDFCPNSPKLVRKLSKKSDFQKKALHVILGAILLNQTMLGAIFDHIFREFAQIFRDFVKIFRDFARILKDFARIFTKSNFLRVRLHPLHPHLLYQCRHGVQT